MNVTFKLAKLDPNGGSTNGVIFYENEFGFGLNFDYFTDKIKTYAWDNYKYMNVYIQADYLNNGNATQSGIAWLPSSADSDNGIARVLYNGQYLHDNTTN